MWYILCIVFIFFLQGSILKIVRKLCRIHLNTLANIIPNSRTRTHCMNMRILTTYIFLCQLLLHYYYPVYVCNHQELLVYWVIVILTGTNLSLKKMIGCVRIILCDVFTQCKCLYLLLCTQSRSATWIRSLSMWTSYVSIILYSVQSCTICAILLQLCMYNIIYSFLEAMLL